MDPEKVAFWGIALKPGEPADLELQDGETLHVTNASLGEVLADEKGRSVVTATIRQKPEDEDEDDDEDDDDGEDDKASKGKETEEIVSKYAVTSLNAGKNESCVLDVSFVGDENVTFEVTGKNVVHLVGSFSFDHMSDDSDSDEDDLIGEYDDDDDDDEEDSADEDEDDSQPRLMLEPPTITELPDDESEEEVEDAIKRKGKKANKGKEDKKAKLPNGKGPSPVKKTAGQSDKKAGKASAEKKVEAASPKEARANAKPVAASGKPSTSTPKTKASVLVEAAVEGKEDVVADVMDIVQDLAEQPGNVQVEAVIEEEVKESAPKSDNGLPKTPQSGSSKKNRNKKRKASVEISTPAGTTTPSSSTKKTKVSERQATPAAVKSLKTGDDKAVKSDASNGSSPGGKAVKMNGEEAGDSVQEPAGTESTPSRSANKRRRRGRKRLSTDAE